jgi:GAF domain-containing protein
LAPGRDDPGPAERRDAPQGEATRLYLLARALGETLTAAEVASVVFEEALEDLGAASVGLWLRETDDVIRFAGGAGYERGKGPDAVGDITLDSDLPAAVCLRSGQIVSYGNSDERDARWPELIGLSVASQAVAVVPLVAPRGRRTGALHIGWPEPRHNFHPDEDLLRAIGDLTASALERARLYEGERRARETLEFLNQATRLMVSALDPDEIVRAIVRLAVPHLAPWCAVYVAEDKQLHRVAIEFAADPDLAADLREAPPVPIDADISLAEAFRTGRTVELTTVSPDEVYRTYPRDTAEKLLALPGGPWSGLVLPVQASGEVIGVMSLLSHSWRGRPSSEARYASEGLAARAGVALRNAQRYREQVDNVRLLTAALLPESVPRLPGLTFAARYAPASGGVSGDWYEAESLPRGPVLVGIGDASGHGVPAAATMAHVRNAARGLAVAGMPPGRMMEHLSALPMGGPDRMATSLYGLLDPVTGAGVWANAGHPPPIEVRPDGTVTRLEMRHGPPLGTGSSGYPETRADVPAGGKIVLYTDGLFERRGEDPMLGIQRLVDVVAGVARSSPEDVAEALVAARPGGEDDDACVLVIAR